MAKAFKRIARGILMLGLALLVVGAVLIGPKVWPAFFPNEVYETTPPQLPEALPANSILIFSKTNGFREDEAISVANDVLQGIARDNGWVIVVTENGAVFNAAQLSQFSVVVWNNVSGPVLNEAQKAAFKGWLEAGGGFVGIHGTGDGSQRWPWFQQEVIGADFKTHTVWPHLQTTPVKVEREDHPAMIGLPELWSRTDEWYSFKSSVRVKGYEVLASIDEKEYKPRGLFYNDIGQGDHPVIWSHCVGRGRALYSALGHPPEAYQDALHRQFLRNAIAWAMDDRSCVR